MQVNVLEAKNSLSQLIKSAQAGEEVVIANRGEPAVRLVPVSTGQRARAGTADSVLDWLQANPLPIHARRGADDIDASIQAEREAWG